MDVTCDRCSTVYEFDETLLSARGTPVKCTNCGHVFKVFPRAGDANAASSHSWRLRRKDGSVDTIDSLRELQRRIGSGLLTPDDQIARGDEGWKALGSIPELETFFRAAGMEVASGRIPSPLPPEPPRKDSSLPPGRRPRQPTLLGVSPVQRIPAPAIAAPDAFVPVAPIGPAEESGAPDASLPEPTPASEADVDAEPPSEEDTAFAPDELASSGRSYRSPYRDSLPDEDLGAIEDAEFEEASEAASAAIDRASASPAYYDDDDDIPELPARGTSALRWLLAIVLVGGLALVAVQWERVAALLGLGADPALIAAGIAEGDAFVEEAYLSAYEQAIDAYKRALAAGGDADLELFVKLSNAHALAAQARLDDGLADPGAPGLATEAMAAAKAAAARDAASLPAQLALVDALRLGGDTPAARQALERARGQSFSRTAEFFRVEARVTAAEAEGRLESGLGSARRAAELAPKSTRYALLHARAELAAGNADQAREALTRILDDHPEHPVARQLLESISSEDEADAEPTSEVAQEVSSDEAPDSDSAEEVESPEDPESPAEPQLAEAPDAKSNDAPDTQEAAPSVDTPVAPQATAKATEATEPSTKATPSTAKEPRSEPAPRRPSAPARTPRIDEYDRLAQAAQSDAFVDGRPPVTDYETNMTKGREELDAGNYARARAYFDSALEVHPGSADAMDALGDVATAVSDYGSALRYYRVAAQRGHPDGYYKLGQSYERLGRNEEAVSAYYTYVKRRPTGKHADAARDAIKTLEPRAKLPPEPEPEPEMEPGEAPEGPTETESP